MFGNSIILLATMTQRAHEKMDQTYSMSYKYHGISERRKSSHMEEIWQDISHRQRSKVFGCLCVTHQKSTHLKFSKTNSNTNRLKILLHFYQINTCILWRATMATKHLRIWVRHLNIIVCTSYGLKNTRF